MQMPIAVGILVAVIFLIAFSEWFYNLIIGWREYVLDDIYFRYRIVGVSLLSMMIISGTFFGMALVNECPNEERVGLFAKLDCEEYEKIVVGAEKMLLKAGEYIE